MDHATILYNIRVEHEAGHIFVVIGPLMSIYPVGDSSKAIR